MASETLNILNISSSQIQTASYYFLWITVAIVLGVLILWLMYLLWRNSQYKKKVYILEKIGNRPVMIEDKVKETSIDGERLYHYSKLKIYSPKFDPKYEFLVTQKTLFGTKTTVAFRGMKYSDKIVPILFKDNYIEPIDYDAWNFLIQRLRMNVDKYEKNQNLMRVLPFVALAGVILAFIIGSILWGQNVEKVAILIMEKSTEVATMALQNTGGVQVIS